MNQDSMCRMLIETLSKEFCCDIAGPCGSVDAALDIARSETFDLAELDVNLRGFEVYPVAELLAERHSPFVFLSGYGDEAIPAGRSTGKVCATPFRSNDLVSMPQGVLVAAVY
jgi:DNA-binding response OmpR family regulator